MVDFKFTSIGQMLYILGVSYETEFLFHPQRKWRFDYAIPDKKLAFEYEGIYSGKSRHTNLKGYRNDCEKYNEAALHGWTVIRLTNDMMGRQGYEFVERSLEIPTK